MARAGKRPQAGGTRSSPPPKKAQPPPAEKPRGVKPLKKGKQAKKSRDEMDTDEEMDDMGWEGPQAMNDQFSMFNMIKVVSTPTKGPKADDSNAADEASPVPSSPLPEVDEEQEIREKAARKKADALYITQSKKWHDAELEDGYRLNESLYRGLLNMDPKFSYGPLPIQRAIFSAAVKDRKDIIGAAQTGSGKTLAYLLPCLTNIMANLDGRLAKKKKGLIQGDLNKRLEALIVVPGRELAKQVAGIANGLVAPTQRQPKESQAKWDLRKAKEIRCLAVIGGVVPGKQIKYLDRHHPQLVVGTPGRVWMLTAGTDTDKGENSRRIEASKYFSDWNDLRFFILDEADCMTDAKKGQFRQLDQILMKIRRKCGSKLQRMVFSATLAVPPHLKKQFPKAKLKSAITKGAKQEKSSADRLMEQVDLREGETFVVDHTTRRIVKPYEKKEESKEEEDEEKEQKGVISEAGVTRVAVQLPENLTLLKDTFKKREKYSELPLEEERLYLHLLRHFQNDFGTKAIVFVNATSGVFRISRLLKALFGDDGGDKNKYGKEMEGVAQRASVYGLSSELKQGQRLAHIEGFTKNTPAILICTDATARGIDIAGVDLVIHYQCPRNAATFIHRSGRTARGVGNFGTSLVLDYDSKKGDLWRSIFRGLNMDFDAVSECDWIPRITNSTFHRAIVKERVYLAQNIIRATDKDRKKKKDKTFNKTMTREMDMELEGEFQEDSSDSDEIDDEKAEIRNLPQMKELLYKALEKPVWEPEPLWKQRLKTL